MNDEDNKPRDGHAEPHPPAPHPEPTPAPEPIHEASPEEAQAVIASVEEEAAQGHDHTHEPASHAAETDSHAAHQNPHPEPEPHPAPEPHPQPPADPEPAPAADPEPVHPADPEPVAPSEPAPVPADPDPAPVADPDPAPPEAHADPALAVAGAAAAGAAAGAAASRPIWSDDGDAPFEEPRADEPRYDRDRGRSRRERRERRKGGFFSELFDIVKTVVYALLIAMVVRIFAFQPFTIPSASMEPNLYEGDYIVVSKWSYGYSRHSIPWSPPIFDGRVLSRMAERGDIVVFKRPNNDGQGYTDYIKRVIGLPGDRVQMIANRLHINGEPVQDVVVEAAEVRGAFAGSSPVQLMETLPGGHEFRIQDFGPGSPSDDTDEFVVPEGHYFVMGDNRDDSMDSRYVWEAGGVGLVPHENLVGKAQVILFSWTPGASLFNPVSWFANVRPERFFTDLE